VPAVTGGLPRAIGRVALTGLVLNAVIGSSVFGLPAVIAARLGRASPWAWVVAAAGMALVVACFAEVASRFRQAGGAYIYARAAFGPLVGIQMAWLTYLVRLTAAATNANLFVIYLAEFWPRATGPTEARLILGAVVVPLALANYRGVGAGLGVSSAFTVAKLLPLGVFVALGLPVVASDIAGHREVLGEGSRGLVPGTAAAFAERLTAVLADADLRGRMAAENRTRARSEFDARDMLAALEGVYRQVLTL